MRAGRGRGREPGQPAERRAGSMVGLAGGRLRITPLGRFFLRNIAMVFDAYLGRPVTHTGANGVPQALRFSRTV